jgi:hypothetical protein
MFSAPKIDAILISLPARSRIVAKARIALRALPLADAESSHFLAFLFRLSAIAWAAGKFFNEADTRLISPAFRDQAHTPQYASVPAIEQAQQFFRFIDGKGCRYACDRVAQIAMAMAISACEVALAADSHYADDPTLPRSPIFLTPVSWEPAVDQIVKKIKQADVGRLKPDMDAEAFAAEPLWPNGAPEWAETRWARFMAALPANEGWDVWTAWYEGRLNGRVRDADVEFAFALVPMSLWGDDVAAEGNRWILDALRENGNVTLT